MKKHKMNDTTKNTREDYTKTIFDALWLGRCVWDALVDMEENRHIPPSKALNCKRKPSEWNELKYEMDWKQTGFKVILNGGVRPIFGIWEFFFGNDRDKCFHRAIKWLDDVCEKEQRLLFDVTFMAGDTPVRGHERIQNLTKEFIKYLNSIQPEVSQEEANRKADEIIQQGA